MEFEVIEYDPNTVPDEFWDSYIEFTHANALHDNPDDPLPDRESVIKRQKTSHAIFIVKRWVAISPNNKIVGWGGFGTAREETSDYEANKHICTINIRVHHDYHRLGIGTELLKQITSEALKRKIKIMETGADSENGRAFLNNFGASLTIEYAENRLLMSEIDWELMQKWVDDGSIRAKDVTTQSFTEIPKEIIEEFAEMYTEALNMQPLGETETRANLDGKTLRKRENRHKGIGIINYTIMAKEKDGRISGLTEILYDSREQHIVHQELTGVRPEFRGRGLGKWLKAQMVFYIKETYPEVEFIQTGNAEANAPMMSINERMGFKKNKSGEGYKIEVEELSKKLGI
jgi:GNAT superfamily N-acetyltransferase